MDSMKLHVAGRQVCVRSFHKHRSRGTTVRTEANFFSKLFSKAEPIEKVDFSSQQPLKKSEIVIKSSNTDKPEFPPYTVVKRGPAYDLRLYDVYPVVEMNYDKREEGYSALGAFIDGRNTEAARFAYGQPVIMRYYPSGRKAMQMLLGTRQLPDGTIIPPSKNAAEAMSSMPEPKGLAGVSVSVAGGELVAVLKFEGYITPSNAEKARNMLMTALQRDGIQLAEDEKGGFFRCAQYGAVYQLAGRLNEMMLKVKP